jgi:hypothetical protein
VSKEAISIPEAAAPRVSWLERQLAAAIMGGGATSIHGLTGKPLMCAFRRKLGLA